MLNKLTVGKTIWEIELNGLKSVKSMILQVVLTQFSISK